MTAPSAKHPCPDCRQCQWCSDDRCRLCLKSGCRKKLSIAEQIALYESLNAAPCQALVRRQRPVSEERFDNPD